MRLNKQLYQVTPHKNKNINDISAVLLRVWHRTLLFTALTQEWMSAIELQLQVHENKIRLTVISMLKL